MSRATRRKSSSSSAGSSTADNPIPPPARAPNARPPSPAGSATRALCGAFPCPPVPHAKHRPSLVEAPRNAFSHPMAGRKPRGKRLRELLNAPPFHSKEGQPPPRRRPAPARLHPSKSFTTDGFPPFHRKLLSLNALPTRTLSPCKTVPFASQNVPSDPPKPTVSPRETIPPPPL